MTDAVDAREAPDHICQQLWMLSGRQMTTREPLDVDPEPREPFARCRDLSGLEGVLLAGGDVEGNGVGPDALELRVPESFGSAKRW